MHIGIDEGMINQRVYSIVQTSDGAVWWTTKAGVDRANGNSVKNYSVVTDAIYSGAAGKVVKIAQTEEAKKANGKQTTDNLYIFDNNGHIFKYNTIQDRFDLLTSIVEIVNHELVLNDMFVQKDCIWLAMNDGIYKLVDGKVEPVLNNVYANCFIKTDKQLLFCTKEGIYNEKGIVLKGEDVLCGYYDYIYNKVWLGTFGDGIKIADASCKNIIHALGDATPHNPIRSIHPYGKNLMLIGIDGFGVYQASRQNPNGASLLFDANEGVHGVLHGNGIYALLVDSWDNIVIGSYSGGIDVARPTGSTTAIFQHIRNNKESLLNDHVNCVAQYTSDMLLMGTDDGVSIFNSATSQWKHVGQGAVVLDICKTNDGKLLAATYGKGVCEIGVDGSARELYSVKNGILKDDHVYKLMYDKEGNLWMACLDGALVEKTAEGFKYYDIKYINALALLSDGQIAVGSATGLYFVNPKTGKVTEIKYAVKGLNDINRYVFDLYSLNSNALWIATDGGGAYVYNPKTKDCVQISTDNGLPSNSVSSITRDKTGRMWLATDNGIAFVHPDKPTEVVDVNYCYGLRREYTRGAVCNLVNGDVMYGSVAGAVIINPKNIQRLNYVAKLNILSVSCGANDSEEFREEVYEMLKEGELHLSYNQRTFELFFESINLRNQFDIAYQYKMGDEKWSQLSDVEYIRFENLEAGTHKLLLRCVSKTSGTVLDEKELTVIIDQPWWNSWWMQLLYFLLVALAFYGAWRVYDLHNKYMRLVVRSVNENDDAESSLAENLEPTNEQSEDEEDGENIEDDAVKDFVDKATKIVLDNISNAEFSIDDLCSEMAMSRTLFYVKLKSYIGKSPQDFVRIIRLERATSLLRSGKAVTDVAVMVGFDNPKYFSTVFKKYFGVSPSKYQ